MLDELHNKQVKLIKSSQGIFFSKYIHSLLKCVIISLQYNFNEMYRQDTESQLISCLNMYIGTHDGLRIQQPTLPQTLFGYSEIRNKEMLYVKDNIRRK